MRPRAPTQRRPGYGTDASSARSSLYLQDGTAAGRRVGGLAQVGEDRGFKAELLDGAGGIEDGMAAVHDQRALPVGVPSVDDLLVGRQRGLVPAGADQPVMAGQQRVD